MKRILFKLLSKVSKQTIDEYITQRWSKPLNFDSLQLAFVDTNGKAWYEFPDGLGNPMKRMAANLQAYEYLTARMSPDMFDAACEDINKALAHGKVVEAGAILTRLKTLKDEVIPVDVLINLIATDLVREDENPKENNPHIHQEKCDYLKGAIERGDSFFFRLTVVKDLSKRFKISNESWTVILKGFQEAVKAAKAERDILLSMNSKKG
jgi:hypothetical protein